MKAVPVLLWAHDTGLAGFKISPSLFRPDYEQGELI